MNCDPEHANENSLVMIIPRNAAGGILLRVNQNAPDSTRTARELFGAWRENGDNAVGGEKQCSLNAWRSTYL